MNSLDESLKNYRQFVDKVDDLCRRIGERFQECIVCEPGCDSCCRHLTLFPVEAVALAAAACDLPEETRIALHEKVTLENDKACPLLLEGRCLLYTARPLICRTHGLPILSREDGTPRIDFCPHNFRGIESLPGEAVINLDQLNAALAAINAVFLASPPLSGLPVNGRLTIAAALRLNLSDHGTTGSL